MTNEMNEQEQTNEETTAHIVGLGASAGGLEALITFFENMPFDTGMAFVVIQHLSPDHKSLMDELLAKHTEMKILQVEDGIMVQPNHIYLLPPKRNLSIFNQKLLLTNLDNMRGLNLPIDVFFTSLAEDQGERAIGIIFSGTGSDGSRGIKAIKQAGGMVMVQDEKSAKFDGMPRSAVSTGMVDYITPPEKMPEIMLSYIRHPLIRQKKILHIQNITGETEMTKIIALLRSRTSVDFTYYKPSTVIRRLERRMGIVQTHTLKEYLEYLNHNPEEVHALYKDLLIGVTKFFRDHDEFSFFREKVIPVLFEKNKNDKSIRVWVVGCSTGEEAFTIAILLQDYMDSIHENYEIKVFATDIDKDAIDRASQGYYPDGIAADLAADLLEKYFIRVENGYKVKRHIREKVIFASHNVLREPPFTKMDLITCRNLLIYLQNNLQRDVLAIFHFALKDGGYLFLGTSESVGELSENFISLDPKIKIFIHKGTGIPPIKDAMRLAPNPVYKNKSNQLNLNPLNLSPAKRLELQERYYQEIINELKTFCMVVNETGELIETFGKPELFLKPQLGRVNLDIMKMVPKEIALALSTGIRSSLKERKRVTYQGIRLKDEEGADRVINLGISPLANQMSEENKLLVIFEYFAIESASRLSEESYSAQSQFENDKNDFQQNRDQHILDIEKELRFTKESLQATIEELQTSNEELQATNEELLASNEELQSTNEELNSVNEELNTVNAEYQSKITELSELNTDMDNLLRSTEIGTIFLDNALRIRKFTPAITREINLLKQDIGRPVADLSAYLLQEIEADVKAVLYSSKKIEKSIKTVSGTWYLIQILPYLDESQMPRGVVISLVNVTDLKNAEKKIQFQHDMLKRVLEINPAATIMLNNEGTISFVNRQAEITLGFFQENLLNMSFDSPELNFTDLDGNLISDTNNPFEIIKKSKKQVIEYIMSMNKATKQQTVFAVTGNPMFNEKGDVEGAVFKFEKVAHQTLKG